MTTTDSLRAELRDWAKALAPVEWHGASKFTATCPSHGDEHPSLDVAIGRTRVIGKCWSGCSQQEMLDAVNALRNGSAHVPIGTSDVSPTTALPRVRRRSKKDPLDELAAYCGVDRSVIDALPVEARDGKVAFLFGDDLPAKTRVMGAPKKDGLAWEPAGLSTPPIWPLRKRYPKTLTLTEGETDCIVLRSQGVKAYAITKGAGRVLTPTEIGALRDRGVEAIVLAFDLDSSGSKADSEQTTSIIEAGLMVATIRPPTNPLLGEKDWRDVQRSGRPWTVPDPDSDDSLFLAPAMVADLLDHPPDPLIDGWFHRGAVLLIVGGPKDGKSSLAFGLFAACLNGTLFAGLNARHMPGPVMVSEEGYDTLGEKIRRYSMTDFRLLTRAQNPGLTFAEVVMKAARVAEREGRPVLIDTLRAWAGIENEGDASEVGRALDIVRSAVIPRGIACIVVHQTNRSGTYRGTTEFLAQVETMVEVTRVPEDDMARSCQIISRYEGAADPVVLIREGGLYLNAGAPRISYGKSNDRMVKRRQDMKVLLAAGPRTMAEITSMLAIGKDTALADLRAIGAVERRSGPASERKTWSVDDSVDDSVDATPQPEPASSVVVDERHRIRVSRRQPSTDADAHARAKAKAAKTTPRRPR
ncbi:MAG TPA: AAA family ATPase [Candidatus Limnocylindrales bacterium]|jgi:hypothetical protein|nr:AAA family ATPase [Candidatus Limnocylindrales bacterium]